VSAIPLRPGSWFHRGFDTTRSSATIRSIPGLVLTMRESEIDLLILNNPGYSFGLIGVAIAEANRIPKRNKLRDYAQQAGFDHVRVFREHLTTALAERGYQLRWSDPVMAIGKKGDAALDVNFGFFGYAAAGSSDHAPYRPAGVISARLVSRDGRTTLLSDQVVYNNVFNAPKAITIDPDDTYVYPDFDDLDAAGVEAISGLEFAARALADQLARQL